MVMEIGWFPNLPFTLFKLNYTGFHGFLHQPICLPPQTAKELVNMSNRYKVVFIALLFATGLAAYYRFGVHAQTATPPPDHNKSKDCASCHPQIHAGWFAGAHSASQTQAVISQSMNCTACHKPSADLSVGTNQSQSQFGDFWVKSGMSTDCLSCHSTGYDPATGKSKADGITCEACHGLVGDNHPKTPALEDKSTDLCRKCHTTDRFNWDKWKESAHYKNSMACVTCHNPHTTTLKIANQSGDSAAGMCKGCHKVQTQTAQHSVHAKIGITCVDCHLGDKKGSDDFHKTPDHDFKPKIETCIKCHSDQMHKPGKVVINTQATWMDDIKSAAAPIEVPASPLVPFHVLPGTLGYVGLAMLAGIFGGVVWRKSLTTNRISFNKKIIQELFNKLLSRKNKS
jgi:predicted CXXCH cytochrome family protein